MSNPFERKGIKPINDPKLHAWLKRMEADAGWFLTQPEHLERYQGLVVVLHNRVVLGSGPGHREAMEDARQRAAEQQQELPSIQDLLCVPMPYRAWLEDSFFPPEDHPTVNGEGTGSAGC